MATITIDGTTFTFFTLRGEPEPVGLEVEPISRPGVHGHAYWEDAKRGRPFEMEGYADYASFTDATASFNSMKSKQGKIGTVVDDRARIFLYVAVLSVERVSIRPVSGVVGGLLASGAAKALLIVRFVMQSTK